MVSAQGRQEPIVKYGASSTYTAPVQKQHVPVAAVPKKGGLFDGDDDEDEYGAEKP